MSPFWKAVLYLILFFLVFFSSGCRVFERINRSSSVGTDTLQYAEFPPEIVSARRGAVLIEVPPVYELMQVGLALTDVSQTQPFRYTHPDTEYYRKMMETFGDDRDHPWITALNESMQSPTSYRAIFAYQLTEEGIEGPDSYHVDHLSAAFQPQLDLMADFAEETGFMDFYRQHRPFYEDEIRR